VDSTGFGARSTSSLEADAVVGSGLGRPHGLLGSLEADAVVGLGLGLGRPHGLLGCRLFLPPRYAACLKNLKTVRVAIGTQEEEEEEEEVEEGEEPGSNTRSSAGHHPLHLALATRLLKSHPA